jgi:hypothetical protein
MSRMLWFVAGAGAGIYAISRARRVAEVFTPDGLADRLAGLSVGARLFADEVRAGAADKENEMRQRVGVRFPELTADTGAAGPEALDDSTGREEA